MLERVDWLLDEAVVDRVLLDDLLDEAVVDWVLLEGLLDDPLLLDTTVGF